jgi:hypothetical protein
VNAADPVKRALMYLWSLPNTLLGIAVSALAVGTGGRIAIVDGVMETRGGAASFLLKHLVLLRGGASAMTLGHVVLGRDAHSLDRTRAHERAHVRQYEMWGPFFLPAYIAASMIAAARGRHYYRANRFEREARAAEGPGPRRD